MVNPSESIFALPVHLTYPPSYFFQFPPSSEPQTLTPPISDTTLARPFNINPELYSSALNVAVPVSIAIIYATTVSILNRVNNRREHRPWPISKSLPFYFFVLVHNVLLATFSAWIFLGMANAFKNSWPGWSGPYRLAGAVDGLCKIHGPRGMGSAATYGRDSGSWGVTDKTIQLLNGSPDSTDVGRIWNEGLAFYGWLFYVSKFYEIVDTFIILAKGKKSSLLQTYHHAGAMMCLWAGIRYMSPPIWMFVLINSGLHALMYAYYTLGTLAISVPSIMKKTLTTLQIGQFIFGASYAAAHLFIAYDIPVSVPYLFIHNLSSAIPSAASSVSSAVASATATAEIGNWLKKIALRAAGEEGLAANVRNRQGDTFGIDAVHAADVEKAQEEIRYKTEYHNIRCIDTSGEAFAILLNVIYLAPLTYLFINFFIRTYISRSRAAPPPPDHKKIAKESSHDAIEKVEREIREAMNEQNNNEEDIPPEVKAKLSSIKPKFQKGVERSSSNARNIVQDAKDAAKGKADSAEGRTGEETDNEVRTSGDLDQSRDEEQKTEGQVKDELDRKDQQNSQPEKNESGDADAEAYEVNPDEMLSKAEKKAEKEFQANGA